MSGGRGDEAELFRRHHGSLIHALERRLRVPRELAEDACSFAWLQLLRCGPERERVAAWLYTVAKHEALLLLARRPTGEHTFERIVAVEHLDDQVEAREALAAIAHLKPQQQLVLRLRLEGYSYDEICRLTGRTYTWVNRHVTEGRKALHDLLHEREL